MENSQESLILKELLAERKKDRRASYVKYAVLGLVGFLYVGVIYSGLQKPAAPLESYAAVVRISGEIGPDKAASLEGLNTQLEAAFSDSNAKGVVLVINSPGGTPVQSALVNERITALKKKHNKKVIAVGEDMLTSGAYMIAVSADKILVNRSTLAGSIGVISRGFGFEGLMDKLGVERRVMTSGESKNLLDPFGPQTEQDKAKQAELLEKIHKHFKDVVASGRGKRLDLNTPGLFSGTVWTGEDAVKMGLVDGLGDLHTAVQDELGAKVTYEYKPAQSLLSTLTGGLGVKLNVELAPAAQSAVSALAQ